MIKFTKGSKIATKIGGMTCQFGLGCQFIGDIQEGDLVNLTVIGKYSDEQVACWIIELNGERREPNGTLLHITTRNYGVSLVESGIRATKHGYTKVKPFEIVSQKAFYVIAD